METATIEKHVHRIEVIVTYPSAHHPVEHSFPPDATVRQVKDFALEEFHLKEETVDGNKIVFFLYHDRHKIENLDQPISDFLRDPHQHELTFRLAKEVIAG